MSCLRVSLSETGVSILGAEVFIIDDRSVNRKILTKFASSVGDDITVSAFPNPVDALEACARTVPDLVITDFKMPLMDGAGFIRNLRGRPATADVPVIVVTAYEDHEIRREALEAGATDFILSPVDPWEFQTRARNLLRLRAQQLVIHRQTVRESEERFRLLVEGVRDYAIVMLDPAGRVTSWNTGAERLLGYSEQEILGQPAWRLDPADGAGAASSGVAAMLKAASSDGSVHGEHVRVRKDGSRFHADILVTSMRDEAGRLAGFSMVTHDITTRRDMENALRDALAESQVLLRELHHPRPQQPPGHQHGPLSPDHRHAGGGTAARVPPHPAADRGAGPPVPQPARPESHHQRPVQLLSGRSLHQSGRRLRRVPPSQARGRCRRPVAGTRSWPVRWGS